jgi:NAD+ kinase
MNRRDLPCSAKLVLKIIEAKGKATFKELLQESLLPERTLREAIRLLIKGGFIKRRICLNDTRTRIYECIKVEREKNIGP